VLQGTVTMRTIYVIFCAAILPAICLGHDLTSSIKAVEHSIAGVEPKGEILSGKKYYHDLRQSYFRGNFTESFFLVILRNDQCD
jgi:hypothetical protein